MIAEEAALLAIVGLFSYLRWLAYLRFLDRAGAENFEAAAKAAAAYPNHNHFVGRVFEAWATARRKS